MFLKLVAIALSIVMVYAIYDLYITIKNDKHEEENGEIED